MAQIPVGPTVLIVDDEQLICELIKEMLERMGYESTICTRASDGLREFQRFKHGLVFADLSMPEIDGWDLSRSIKAISPETRVVLVTGLGHWVEPGKLVECGVNQLLSKPFQFADVRLIVQQALTPTPDVDA